MARKPAEKKIDAGKKQTKKKRTPAGGEILRSAQDDRKKKQQTKTKPVRPAERKEPLTTAEWRKIRIEYVKGKTTYQKLAEKYGVSASNIRKRASKEAWGKKKNKLDTKVEQKVLERVCDARAREFELIAQVNDRMDLILNNLVQFVSDQPPKKYDDLKGVESLTKAIAQVVQTKRDLYNVPTEIDKAKIETLRDKQKLEREKFQAEEAEKEASKHMSESTMIKVIIEGTEEEVVVDE